MKINQLTFSRFFLALLVVIFHFGDGVWPFRYAASQYVVDKAYIGPSFFFVLSGFVLVIAYFHTGDINNLNYYRNRFARIYPIYLVSLAMTLVYFIASGKTDHVSLTDLILCTFSLQSWVPGHALALNYPGWTLSVEVFMYAVFPILVHHIYRKLNLRQSALLVCIIWLASQLFFFFTYNPGIHDPEPSRIHDLMYYFPLFHINSFLIGNILGLFFLNQQASKGQFSVSRNYDIAIVVVITGVLLLLSLPYRLSFHNGCLCVFFALYILLLSANNGKLTRLMNVPQLVFLGEISYGVYILQCPVFYWCKSGLKFLHITDVNATFYISLAALLMVSGLSYQYFEKPARDWISVKKAKMDTAR